MRITREMLMTVGRVIVMLSAAVPIKRVQSAHSSGSAGGNLPAPPTDSARGQSYALPWPIHARSPPPTRQPGETFSGAPKVAPIHGQITNIKVTLPFFSPGIEPDRDAAGKLIPSGVSAGGPARRHQEEDDVAKRGLQGRRAGDGTAHKRSTPAGARANPDTGHNGDFFVTVDQSDFYAHPQTEEWSFTLLRTTCARKNRAGAKEPWLSVAMFSMEETPFGSAAVNDIYADNVVGRWDAALQLALWKLVCDTTRAAWDMLALIAESGWLVHPIGPVAAAAAGIARARAVAKAANTVPPSWDEEHVLQAALSAAAGFPDDAVAGAAAAATAVAALQSAPASLPNMGGQTLARDVALPYVGVNEPLDDATALKRAQRLFFTAVSATGNKRFRLSSSNIDIAGALSSSIEINVRLGFFGGDDLPEMWAFRDVRLAVQGSEILSLASYTLRRSVDGRDDVVFGELGMEVMSRLRAVRARHRTRERVGRRSVSAADSELADSLRGVTEAEASSTRTPPGGRTGRTSVYDATGGTIPPLLVPGSGTAAFATAPAGEVLNRIAMPHECLIVQLNDLKVTVPHNLDVGCIVDEALWQVDALILAISALPNDWRPTTPEFYRFFKRFPPPSMEPMEVFLRCSAIAITVQDDPFESWLENMMPVWSAEKESQRRRAELLRSRIALLEKTEGRQSLPSARIGALQRALSAQDAVLYKKRVAAAFAPASNLTASSRTTSTEAAQGSPLAAGAGPGGLASAGLSLSRPAHVARDSLLHVALASAQMKLTLQSNHAILLEQIRALDTSPQPQHPTQPGFRTPVFGMLLGVGLNLELGSISARVRAFPFPLFAAPRLKCNGNVIVMHMQTRDTEATFRTIAIDRHSFVCARRSFALPKIIFDVALEALDAEASYSPGMEYSFSGAPLPPSSAIHVPFSTNS